MEVDLKNINPEISVVMPAYNAEKYIEEAIQSILDQSFKDFEFIIINDGSADNTLNLVQEFQKKDDRIVLIDRENMGLVHSLNEGISKSKGEYIARMDADDISLENRFIEQLKFMKSNSVDICGSSVQLFTGKNDIKVWSYPLLDRDIKFSLLFSCTFAHPGVMMRRRIFSSLRYRDCKYAEDYRLWVDAALSKFKMANINKVLLKYRLHENQVSCKNLTLQKSQSLLISNFYFSQLKSLKSVYGIYKGLSAVVSSNDLYKLYNCVNSHRNQHKVSDEYFLKFVRHALGIFNSYNLNVFWVYYKIVKPLKRNFFHDVFIFFLCVFQINTKSEFYRSTFRVIEFIARKNRPS